MTEPKVKNKGGKPLAVIDWDQVDAMSAIMCTGEEQAAILGVDYDTLNGACKREKSKGISDYMKEKGAEGKMSLRRKQYTTAIDGNPTMLIWLGKNWLGQTDQPDNQVQAAAPIINIINPKA
jgi:hypothetical protein